MSKSLYAKQITPQVSRKAELITKDFIDPETEFKIQRITPRHTFDSTAERLAKSKTFWINYSDKTLCTVFNNDPDMTTVDYYFPYADGGPLYLDQVFGNYDYDRLQKKNEIMVKNGIRHIVYEDQEDFSGILERLEKIDKQVKKATKGA